MDELCQELETRLKQLIEKRLQLTTINDQLKQAQLLLQREKEKLLTRQKTMVNLIETMIARLKSIEGRT